jgi:hypothetical protein
MRKLMAFALATSLATAGSAYAASAPPAQLNDSELDQVTAGALVNVVAVDVVDINRNEIVKNVDVAIPINASVAIGILGAAGSVATQPGRIFQ